MIILATQQVGICPLPAIQQLGGEVRISMTGSAIAPPNGRTKWEPAHQHLTMFLASMPRVAFRVSTTNCACETMSR